MQNKTKQNKTLWFPIFPTLNDHFTKTGSGQTRGESCSQKEMCFFFFFFSFSFSRQEFWVPLEGCVLMMLAAALAIDLVRKTAAFF
jgi:hypothetical protein